MPSKKNQLTEDIEIRWKITIVTKEVLKFSEYFVRPGTNRERSYIGRHQHIKFISFSLWRLAIIELAKLFSDSKNQKYNLKKLIEKMSPSGEYRSLGFPVEKVNEFQEFSVKYSAPINEISRLRDNYYAHIDTDPFGLVTTSLTIEQCLLLVSFAENVLQSFANAIEGNHYVFSTLHFDSREFDFIKILADLEHEQALAIATQHSMSFEDLCGHPPIND